MDEKIKKRKRAKKSSFLCLWYILRAIRAGRCRERRYADHIFIQIYFRMHHFVVKFSKFSSPRAARGHWPPNQNPADVPGVVSWPRLVVYRCFTITTRRGQRTLRDTDAERQRRHWPMGHGSCWFEHLAGRIALGCLQSTRARLSVDCIRSCELRRN